MGQLLRSLFSISHHYQAVHVWLLLLRICVSAFMLTHGLPKLFKLVSGDIQFADPLGVGTATSLALTVFAEAICSILIIFGFATRIATIPLILNMAVAAFVVHLNDPFNKKELALLYLLIYITLFILGSGRYAIDNWIHRKI